MPDYVPNTVVRCLTSVPLDSTYTDVIKFDSIGAQTAFFMSKTLKTYTQMTYQRVNSSVASPRGPLTVRVPDVADNLYSCNYIMFQNSNYGQKWFYAFVRRVNYISPENTEIEYEIDYYQTWQFDFTVLSSFVEREHTLNDQKFANQQPEPFSLPLLYSNLNSTPVTQTFGPPYYIRVWTTLNHNSDTAQGTMLDNIYNGLYYREFTSAGDANAYIDSIQSDRKLDTIVGINMAPYSMGTASTEGEVSFSQSSSLNGYTPRNKKCYNYPYTAIIASDNAGNTKEYKYEGFAQFSVNDKGVITVTEGRARFRYQTVRSYKGAIGMYPQGYMGSNYNDRNLDYAMYITGFPECAWAGNAFASWLATELPVRATGILSSTLNGVLSSAVNPSSTMSSIQASKTGINTGTQLLSLVQEGIVRANNPGVLQGTIGNPSLNFKMNRVCFEFKEMCATPEYLARLDSFFDAFGYATNMYKLPNMTGRSSYNFVKTRDVILSGSLPVEAMDRIKQMFNDGVRFWHGDFIGNYSLPNYIINEGDQN